jgi:hypothetical protein
LAPPGSGAAQLQAASPRCSMRPAVETAPQGLRAAKSATAQYRSNNAMAAAAGRGHGEARGAAAGVWRQRRWA